MLALIYAHGSLSACLVWDGKVKAVRRCCKIRVRVGHVIHAVLMGCMFIRVIGASWSGGRRLTFFLEPRPIFVVLRRVRSGGCAAAAVWQIIWVELFGNEISSRVRLASALLNISARPYEIVREARARGRQSPRPAGGIRSF
jgi:hypothetical protein